jgi:hypothetical protein
VDVFSCQDSDTITANLPDESITPLSTKAEMGVFYGYAQVIPPAANRAEFATEDLIVLPMVMSLGWNPFYKNQQLTGVSHSLIKTRRLLKFSRKFTSCITSRETFMDMK